MKTRKFILFIVEGITDQTSLGFILDQLLEDYEVRFAITEGDLTSREGITPSNISSKIGAVVKNFSGNSFTAKDFAQVIHLVDLDGAFIPDDKITYSKKHYKPFYKEHEILTSNVESIMKRNERKQAILNRMTAINKVWRTIPYQVFFFSCNLDHVLYAKANLTRSEKMEYAEQFEDRFANTAEQFIDFLKENKFAIDSSYKESWNFIKEHQHSLERHSNFSVYFDNMIPGSKGHVFHACMKKHDFGTRKT